MARLAFGTQLFAFCKHGALPLLQLREPVLVLLPERQEGLDAGDHVACGIDSRRGGWILGEELLAGREMVGEGLEQARAGEVLALVPAGEPLRIDRVRPRSGCSWHCGFGLRRQHFGSQRGSRLLCLSQAQTQVAHRGGGVRQFRTEGLLFGAFGGRGGQGALQFALHLVEQLLLIGSGDRRRALHQGQERVPDQFAQFALLHGLDRSALA